MLKTPTTLLTAAGIALLLNSAVAQAADPAPRERINIDNDWRFTKNDPADNAVNLTYQIRPANAGRGRGAPPATAAAPAGPIPGIYPWILPSANALIADPAKHYTRPDGNLGDGVAYVDPKFDDSSWRQLNLPHDFGIEGPFIDNGSGATGKLPFFGVAWYRKKLDIPAADAGKKLYLDMDGSMSYTTVWLNGQVVGGWPYGYSSFRLDLTPYAKPGADNTLSIRLDNPANSSRWYPGGGIYRDVWLVKTNQIHVAHWGTYLTTPTVTKESATVALKIDLENETKQDATVSVETQVFPLDAEGNRTPAAGEMPTFPAVNVLIPAGKSASTASTLNLANPKLWSPDSPNRYVAVTTVKNGNTVIDQYETPFGVRTIKYDPNAGLFVNGQHYKLNGVCDHHDLGALGTAVNVRALQRQLQMLRDMGCNALRTSHNPPSPQLLEFADQMGFLVLDEMFDTWGSNKSPNDYGGNNLFNTWHEMDARALLRRDRNHPSVIMWSIGNEIAEQSQGANSPNAKDLASIVHSEDPTRPVTAACNGASSAQNGFSTLLDAMGFNYKPDNYISFHENFPTQFFFSTESASTISSRGEYDFPVATGFGGVSNGGGRGGRGGGGGGGAAPARGATNPAGGGGRAGAEIAPMDIPGAGIDAQAFWENDTFPIAAPAAGAAAGGAAPGGGGAAAPRGGRGGAGGGGGAGAGGGGGGGGRGRGQTEGTDFVGGNAATRQMSSYDLYYPTWASSPDHEFYGQDHSQAVAGEFVWTGWDYIGEPTPYNSRSSYFGIIDLAGFPKDRYYLYQAHWRPDFPMAHILPHWNWPERVGQVTPVHVYTSGDEAELFLNGKSLGRKKKIFDMPNQAANAMPKNGEPAYRIRWDDVVYQPGELKVVAYKDGKQWATDTVKTTGAASQLLLKPDRATIAADGHDLSFVTLTVADADKLMVPRTKNLIHFEISGPGEIVATDNGDATDMNIFSKPDRAAFNGLALAIVRTKVGEKGAITLTAKADGLTAASTTITGK